MIVASLLVCYSMLVIVCAYAHHQYMMHDDEATHDACYRMLVLALCYIKFTTTSLRIFSVGNIYISFKDRIKGWDRIKG